MSPCASNYQGLTNAPASFPSFPARISPFWQTPRSRGLGEEQRVEALLVAARGPAGPGRLCLGDGRLRHTDR